MATRQALEGIRICDFSWWGAGPIATKWLGAHGAQVIKIESNAHLDSLRGNEPMPPGKSGLNVSGFYNNFNSDKLGILLNMTYPKAREVAKGLVAISDVVFDNFTPHTMEGWGFTYEELVKIKSDVIVVAEPMQGMTGPHRHYTGSGATIQAVSGIHSLIGYPDRPPVGTGTAFPDYSCNPHHCAFVILSALHYRNRTGKGQYIDMSQLQSTMNFIGPELMDYTVNGRVQGSQGNRRPYASPHGVYGCKGGDRWCVIDVRSDEEWRAFCRVLGHPAWTREERFATFLGRQKDWEELDRLVEQWTCRLSAEEVMFLLQGAGVAAGVVQNSQDLLERDPQLRAREHFRWLEHPEAGPHAYNTPPFKLSATPADVHLPAPLLGQHTEYVLRDLLGMTEEEVNDLMVEGAIG